MKKDEEAQKLGSKGGQKTLKKYGRKHFRKLIQKRWSKKRKTDQ